MKSTEEFKKVISQYLDGLALKDTLFAETLKKPKKNIEDCVTYILNQVQQSGNSGFADSEIFGMAVHYYDEDDIIAGKAIDCQVVVNHKVKLSKEDIELAKQTAFDNIVAKKTQRIKKKAEVKQDQKLFVQQSLF